MRGRAEGGRPGTEGSAPGQGPGRRENDRSSILMMVSSMLIFGTIGIFRRNIPLSSAFLAFARGILGGTFIFLFMKARRIKADRPLSRRSLLLLLLTGALIGINWILLFEAYEHTSVAVATLCYYMQPTIVLLASALFFGERLTPKKLICAVTAIAGMILVSGVMGDTPLRASDLQGILSGLGAAVFYSAVVILNKQIAGVNAYLKTTLQLLSAGAVMIPYLLFTEGFSLPDPEPLTLFLLLVVGIVHTGFAYVLYFGSLEGLNLQSAALFSYIDPASALVFSALLLGEPLNAASLAGAVMIIGSAVISVIQ